jgi:hypothetical protein
MEETPMMIARWTIESRFGHKQQVIDSVKVWTTDISEQIGWTPDKVQIVTGSVGASESVVEGNLQVENLADLGASWDRLAEVKAHKQWSLDLESHVVSSSHH